MKKTNASINLACDMASPTTFGYSQKGKNDEQHRGGDERRRPFETQAAAERQGSASASVDLRKSEFRDFIWRLGLTERGVVWNLKEPLLRRAVLHITINNAPQRFSVTVSDFP